MTKSEAMGPLEADPMSPNLFEESKTQFIIDSIRNLHFEKPITKTKESEIQASNSEDELFLKVCKEISKFSGEEFQELEDLLLAFVLKEWESDTNSCFKTLQFVADVFEYISLIASKEIVLEYLKYFGKPSTPAQVRLFLYPSVLKAFKERFNKDEDEDENDSENFVGTVEKLLCHKVPADLSSTEATKLVFFWKKAFQSYIQSEGDFDNEILTGFLICQQFVRKLCETDEHRIAIFKSLAMCLHKKPTVTSLLLSSIFVVSLETFEFNQKSFSGMSLFLDKLTFAASHHKGAATDFVKEVVTRFLNSVQVEENLLLEMAKGFNVKIMAGESPRTNASQGKSLSQDSKSSPSRPGQGSEKFLDMLEKLVGKMKGSNVWMGTKSEEERLKKIVSELNSFL